MQIYKFNRWLNETIDPSEAMDDKSSIQTIIDGKRNVAFITTFNSSISASINSNKLRTLQIHEIDEVDPMKKKWIIYKPEAEEDARKLLKITNDNDGYLRGTPEEQREIGRILNYDPEKVEAFIKKEEY